jgi:hypothetical protein
MTRTEVIQRMIDFRGFKTYLEIGSYRNENVKNLVIDRKITVDPDPDAYANYQMTSDQYFDENDEKFDIIFIDGLHEHSQVWRDIRNSLEHLNPNGVIVMHDCMPKSEKMQVWDNKSHQSEEWTGDTWKAYYKAYAEKSYKVYVVDTDYGCGVIDTSEKYKEDINWKVDMEKLKYEDYLDLINRNAYGVIPVSEYVRRTR